MNPFGVPEVSVEEVAEMRQSGDAYILMDVREPQELNLVDLGDDVTLVPLSQLAQRQLDALPDEVRLNQDAHIVVFCHTGRRSAQVTAWLMRQGWTDVWNMAGGVEAYALRVDPSIGRY